MRSISSPSVKQGAQRVEIDARQDFELVERDVLVQLVDARVDRPHLDHLGADVDDEARIRGAAGGRKLAVGAGMPLAGLEDDAGQPAALAQEWFGAERPV